MRVYQTKANLGGIADSNLAVKDGANEYNSLRKESETAVTRAALTPAPQNGTGEDTSQLSQALLINGTGASSFQAAGTVDAITLTPVTGVNGLKLPPDYVSLHGMRVGFFPTGANTGNVTISVGQDAGSQFGTKKALNNDGSEIAASKLTAAIYVDFVFDETADTSAGAFVLVPYSLATGGSGSDTTKVDKDLSSDVDYVPKVTLDGTEEFYIDDNGVSKKVLASNITTADTQKVDKDLSNDTDYVPTTLVDDTDDYYVDKAGVPSKISGLNLKAQINTYTLLDTRTTNGTWTLVGLTIGRPLFIGADHSSAPAIGASEPIAIRVESGSIIGASSVATSSADWIISAGSSTTSNTTPTFVLIPIATTVVLTVSMDLAEVLELVAYH